MLDVNFCGGMMRLIILAVGLLWATSANAGSYNELLALAKEWRALVPPPIRECRPDYSKAATDAKAKSLKDLRAKLQKLGPETWSLRQQSDYRLIEAEMNGLDFSLRVLRPWARDPSFYATLFAEQSDVPAHEGSSAEPVIDLYAYQFPLSAADQRRLTCEVGAIPAILNQAKQTLKESNARDLWLYGARAFREQGAALARWEAGSLDMRTLTGKNRATLEGTMEPLRVAVRAARHATEDFAAWIAQQVPGKTGPSGVGKSNYDWYQRHVHLLPYDWQAQETLLKRELERAWAGLREEELRNRALPQLDSKDDAETFTAFASAKMTRIADFLVQSNIVPDRPYFRDALFNQIVDFSPPAQRNFFLIGVAHDPLGLYSHDYHWIELARLRFEPNESEIRRLPILDNMFDTRSEGLATAMEEVLMQAGLYDDNPRGREIVWIMLANRAARGLASLYVQANEMNLAEAGQFHARWTPRGWSDPHSDLVAFEQLLYLRQPGYGTSYITGKMQFDRLISLASYQADQEGRPFDLAAFFQIFNQSGIIPFSLIEKEMLPNVPSIH
jgi:hypothetical protein